MTVRSRVLADLTVACAIDRDVFALVRKGDARRCRPAYDISVVDVLRSLCREVPLVGVSCGDSRAIEELSIIRPDVVFNLALSATPEEADFAKALEQLGIPYTGSNARSITVTNNKIRARRILSANGVTVPRSLSLAPGEPIRYPDFGPPWIIKPSRGAASVGIHSNSVIREVSEAWKLPELVRRVWTKVEGAALCEEFVVGREFRIGMVENKRGIMQLTAISEWKFGAAPPGWGYKTESIRANLRVRQRQHVTRAKARLPRHVTPQITTLGRIATSALGVGGYTTIDVRMNNDGKIVVLEVNSNPGLWHGGVVWTTPSFEANIANIVRAALQRQVKANRA